MGILSFSVIVFSNFQIEINGHSTLLNFLLCTLPLMPLAFLEELGFRAYPLSLLKGTTGVRNSIILTSLLFAVYHVANGWTIQNAFLGAGVWGMVYGLAAILQLSTTNHSFLVGATVMFFCLFYVNTIPTQ